MGAKKSVTISDASSESETEIESDSLLKSASRKRKLSEAPKLQIIPEVVELEETEESPAKKPRRKSVSATAVMQKIDDTPSKRRGRPPKSVGNEESEPKSAKKQGSGKASMATIIEEEKEPKPSTGNP